MNQCFVTKNGFLLAALLFYQIFLFSFCVSRCEICTAFKERRYVSSIQILCNRLFEWGRVLLGHDLITKNYDMKMLCTCTIYYDHFLVVLRVILSPTLKFTKNYFQVLIYLKNTIWGGNCCQFNVNLKLSMGKKWKLLASLGCFYGWSWVIFLSRNGEKIIRYLYDKMTVTVCISLLLF